MPRPTKLVPVVEQAILDIIRQTGASHARAARHAGVDPSTFSQWMRRNSRFANEVEKAEADFVNGLVARTRLHATRDAKTATWLLEHHPLSRAEYGAKATEVGVTLSAPGGGPVEVKHTHGIAGGSAEQLLALAATLDTLARVGAVPQLGAGAPISVGPADAADDAEVVEVHPA